MNTKAIILILSTINFACSETNLFYDDKELEFKEYARTFLKKEGLSGCISSLVEDKDLKLLFSKSKSYFFNQGLYTNSEDIRDIYRDKIYPYINKTVAKYPNTVNDIEKINICLSIYHSKDYQFLINSFDSYIYYEQMNNFFISPAHKNTKASSKDLNDSQYKMSLWGFYGCLSNSIKYSDINTNIMNESKKIQSSINFKNETYAHIESLYKDAIEKYTITSSYDSKDSSPISLGCIILYDTNTINNAIP